MLFPITSSERIISVSKIQPFRVQNLNELLLVQQRVAAVVKLIHVVAMHFLFTERTSVCNGNILLPHLKYMIKQLHLEHILSTTFILEYFKIWLVSIEYFFYYCSIYDMKCAVVVLDLWINCKCFHDIISNIRNTSLNSKTFYVR